MHVHLLSSCHCFHNYFQADGTLKNTAVPTPQQLDELVKLGFAGIGIKGQYRFGKDWDTARLDQWLQETLPVPFERISLMSDIPDMEYHWRLLRVNRTHVELYRENPDGYDFVDARGSRGKSWHDSRLYVGM